VKITIEAAPKDACTIALRIPGWAKDVSISIAGSPIKEPLRAGTYFEINRTWAQGDVIELKLPMPARLIEANPLVEEARNQVTVQRGPLVYCLESPDLPEGTHVSDAAIPADIKLTPKLEPKLLGGVVTLSGPAVSVAEPKWASDLYRDLPVQSTPKIEIKLVPYSAWGNRGKSDMTVWLPLAR
jgi:DUF1680 family protein